MIMKTIPLTILALALSLTAVSAQDGQRPPQITVSGTADVLVVPDEAIIHVAVEIRNENLDQARHLHDDRMKKRANVSQIKRRAGQECANGFHQSHHGFNQ